MTFKVELNKNTDVAFIDLCTPASHLRVDVVNVSKDLGVETPVLARFDEHGNLLGLIVEDYSNFRREIRFKYIAWKVDGIIELMVSKVKSAFPDRTSEDHHAVHC